MDEWIAHSILVESFQALNLSPIAYEQREFTPPADGSTWYGIHNLPAERVPATLGDAGDDRYAGVFQIDVSTEQGQGVRPALTKAAAITAHYRAGRSFTRGANSVRIERSQASPARRDSVRLVVSVSVYWETRINR